MASTTTPDVEAGSETSSATTSSGDSEEEPVSKPGGTATFTIVGETVVLDFTCFFGDADIGDAGFGAFSEFDIDAGTFTLAVTVIDSPFGDNYTVFYAPAGDRDNGWQMVGGDAAIIDGDRVTAEGDFTRIVDGELTDETDFGSLDATCGPESVGG